MKSEQTIEAGGRTMKPTQAVEAAKEHLMKITHLSIHNVTGVKKEKDGWRITVELLEKKSIPDAMDLFGIYEVMISDDGELVNFERKGIRRRGDVDTGV